MKDLNKTLETYLNKTLKIVKKVDKFINGAEKQLVIEVGSHTTKIVEYIVKSDVIDVTGGAVLNTPINAVQNDRLVDIDVLSNVIGQALIDEKIKTKEVVASIVSKEIIIREMNVPQMQDGDLKKFVQINSNDIFPVKLANYVLGYNIVEKGETNRVMIAAIPKDIVMTYLKLGERLGLNFKGINYSGYELYNFLDFEIDNNQESYLAVDIGAQNTNMVIISRGALKFNKIIPKGSEEISKYISEELNCTMTKAEQLKRQYNTIEEKSLYSENIEERTVAKYTQRGIDGIIQDILRIIEFFNSNNQKNKISNVYIIGPLARLRGIEEYITQKVNVPTKTLKILKKVNFDKDAIGLKPRSHNFMNCFGAHNLKDREFQFIKGDLKFKKLSVVLKAKFHKLTICALLVLIAVALLQKNSLNSVINVKDEYNQYIEANSSLVAMQGEIDAKNKEIKVKNKDIDGCGIGLEGNMNIINAVDQAILTLDTKSSAVNITKYKFSKNKIEINGKIELPNGIDQNHENYYIYKGLPYDIGETVEAKVQKEVEVSVNANSITSIVFTLNVEV